MQILDMERKIYISDESNKFFAVQWHIFYFYFHSSSSSKKGYLQIGAIFYFVSISCWFECPNWLYFDLLVSIWLSIYEHIILYINPISLLILLFYKWTILILLSTTIARIARSIKIPFTWRRNFFIEKKIKYFQCMYSNSHLSTEHEYLITISISSTHSTTFISYHNFSQALLHNSFILMHFYHFAASSILSLSFILFYFRRNIIFLYASL